MKPNYPLSNGLHRPIIRKFKKRKVRKELKKNNLLEKIFGVLN